MPHISLPPFPHAAICAFTLSLLPACQSNSTSNANAVASPANSMRIALSDDDGAHSYDTVINVAPNFKLAANRLKGVKKDASGTIIAARAVGGALVQADGIPASAVGERIEISDGVAKVSGNPEALQGRQSQVRVTGSAETEFFLTDSQFTSSGPTFTQITKSAPPPPQPTGRRHPVANQKPKLVVPSQPKPTSVPKMRLPKDDVVRLPTPAAG